MCPFLYVQFLLSNGTTVTGPALRVLDLLVHQIPFMVIWFVYGRQCTRNNDRMCHLMQCFLLILVYTMMFDPIKQYDLTEREAFLVFGTVFGIIIITTLNVDPNKSKMI